MESIARTNVQLYNQLRVAGYTLDELALVHRSYRLAMTLYSGHFQADGTPFVSHVIGVSSIVAHLGLPPVIVAAACVHNVYTNGDFGDGRIRGKTRRRRKMVSDAAGIEVEACISRFSQVRLKQNSLSELRDRLDKLDTLDRQLIVMDLADVLEKYVDHSVLYYGDHRWMTDFVAENGTVLIDLAKCLGYPQLGAALHDAFEATALESVPESLRSDAHQKYVKLVMPNSCRLRTGTVVRQKALAVLQALRTALVTSIRTAKSLANSNSYRRPSNSNSDQDLLQ